MLLLLFPFALFSGRASAGATAEDTTGTSVVTAPVENALAGHYASDFELEHFRLVNELRAEGWTCPSGKVYAPNPNAMQFDCRLWRAARLHSIDMVEQNYYSHQSKDGRAFTDRALAQGIKTSGENIAYGFNMTPQKFVTMWRESTTGHCDGMMNPDRVLFGAGFWSHANGKMKGTQMYTGSNWVDTLDTSCFSDPANGLSPAPTPNPTPAPAPTGRPTTTPTFAPTAARDICSPQPDCKEDDVCYRKYLALCATYGADQCVQAASITSDPETPNCVWETVPDMELVPNCGPHPSDAAADWKQTYNWEYWFGDEDRCLSDCQAKGITCVWVVTRMDRAFNSLVKYVWGF